MANRATRRHSRSRGIVVGGLTLAAMLAATSPLLPAKVQAAGNNYEWVKHEDLDRLNGASALTIGTAVTEGQLLVRRMVAGF